MSEKLEEIFKKNATTFMVEYNHEKFKREYKTLFKVIILSMSQNSLPEEHKEGKSAEEKDFDERIESVAREFVRQLTDWQIKYSDLKSELESKPTLTDGMIKAQAINHFEEPQPLFRRSGRSFREGAEFARTYYENK